MFHVNSDFRIHMKQCRMHNSAIAVTRIKNPDGCSMGSIYHEWLGVTSAETLTPAWTICYQR